MVAPNRGKSATKPKIKNIAILPIVHARAKASAAMHGQELQEWVAEAIEEKLAREEHAKKVTA